MTQEEKEFLLKDLCARLPYGVIIQIPELFYPQRKITEKLVTINDLWHFNDDGTYIEDVKPYLRPLSSMTEEEIEEAKTNGCIIYHDTSPKNRGLMVIASPKGFDWLNKKMFAYRTIDGKDMFELGLAIEAPEGMYNTK